MGATVVLALFVPGCATDGTTARIQEKSEVFATLNPWQQKTVRKGDVAVGFTGDMVYMAVGKPNSVQTKETEKGPAELWTYDRFFPPADASLLRTAEVSSEFASKFDNFNKTSAPAGPGAVGSPLLPKNYNPRSTESSFTTGGPQGGTLEPADLQGYKLYVVFLGGRVVRLALSPL